jgi:hypothetical protein
MSTATNQLQDLSVNNQHLIEQHKNEIISTMLIFFKHMEKLINKEIKASFDDTKTIVDKNALKRRLNVIQERELNKIQKQITKDVHKFLGSQAKNYEKQLKGVLKDVSKYIKVHSISEKALKHNYDKEPIVMEKGSYNTLASLWATFFLSVRTNLNQNTESAYKLKKTTREYTSDLNRGYKISENSLNGIIAVYIQQAVGSAAKSVNGVNEEFIRGYSWSSVLDSKTSDFCISHAYRFWIYNHPELSTLEAEIYSPAHFRCRASNPPIIKSYRELGISASELTTSQKSLLANSKTETLTYNQFFERQTESVKKEILGVVRYNAYQQGNLDVSAFYTRDGRKLTLKQLEKKNIQIADEYLRYVN